MPITHACAGSDISKVGPDWITTQLSGIAKDAQLCSAHGERRKSWTVLFSEDTLRGKECFRTLFWQRGKERNGIAPMSNC